MLIAPSNALEDLLPLIPHLLAAIPKSQPGRILRVEVYRLQDRYLIPTFREFSKRGSMRTNASEAHVFTLTNHDHGFYPTTNTTTHTSLVRAPTNPVEGMECERSRGVTA